MSKKYSPLDKNGSGGNNAYFTKISDKLANKLIALIGDEYFRIIDKLKTELSLDDKDGDFDIDYRALKQIFDDFTDAIEKESQTNGNPVNFNLSEIGLRWNKKDIK